MSDCLSDGELEIWETLDEGGTTDILSRAAAEIRRLRAENATLRDNQRMRAWKCPCGDLVFRDTHYDLECGKCARVQVDADEFMPDQEIHRLREHASHLLACDRLMLGLHKPCTCGLDKLLDAKEGK